MRKFTMWVGLDAHKSSITVARAVGRRKEAEIWQIPNDERAVQRLARKLRRDAGSNHVRTCYEAGPLGFALQRRLEVSGIPCMVVAPSLIPKKPGERVKTDRRDAQKLLELFRAGMLTEVHPPNAEEEAVRDLCRCRESAKRDLLRARHRLGKFLLRRGRSWTGGSNWTQRHHAWLRGLQFDHPADELVFLDYLRTVEELVERVGRLDRAVAEAAQEEPYRIPVGWLRCYRGVDTVTALTVVSELHRIERFNKARHLMGYLGLTPSEHSSGGRRQMGGITKTGNAHVRRVLVEAAWSQRHRPLVGKQLRERRKGQPDAIVAQADRAMQRLHKRYWRLAHKGKPIGKVVTAVARELTGFLWATLQTSQNTA